MPSGLLAMGDHRQPNANGLAFDLRDVETVAVSRVPEDEGFHIQLLLLLGRERQRRHQRQEDEKDDMFETRCHGLGCNCFM